MVIASSDITAFVGALLWPLFRVSGLLMTAPVFAARTVPVRIRLGLSVAITILILPFIPPVPEVDVFSLAAVSIIRL